LDFFFSQVVNTSRRTIRIMAPTVLSLNILYHKRRRWQTIPETNQIIIFETIRTFAKALREEGFIPREG
jgi:zona occludens toxin (predicted ATPase)